MCMIDNCDEMYTLYDQRWVSKTRKPHQCGECGRAIEIGEECRFTTGLMQFDGWCSNYICHHCTFATRWLWVNCSGYVDCGVREDLEYHLEDEAWNWPFATKYAMARVLIGMRRRWRNKKGELMPLPREIPDLEKIAA